jgi:hypothetical protein
MHTLHRTTVIAFILTIMFTSSSIRAQVPDIRWERPIFIDSAALKLQNRPCTFQRIIKLKNSGYVLTGKIEIYDSGSRETRFTIVVSLVDTSFAIRWYREIPNANNYFRVAEGIDSNIMLCFNCGIDTMCVVRIDRNGNIINQKKYPFLSPDPIRYNPRPLRVRVLTTMQNGDYVAGMTILTQNPDITYYGFTRMNSIGNIIWSHMEACKGIGIPKQILEADDGNLFYAGAENSGSSNFSAYGMLSAAGDSIHRFVRFWNQGQNGIDAAGKVVGKKFILAGSWLTEATLDDVTIMMIDSGGTIIKQKIINIPSISYEDPTWNIQQIDTAKYFIQTNSSILKIDTTLRIMWDFTCKGALSSCPGQNGDLIVLASNPSYKNYLMAIGENYPPYFTSTSSKKTKHINACFEYLDTLSAIDTFPNETLQYHLVGPKPTSMSIDVGKGIIRWVPSINDTGVHQVGVTVSDKKMQSDTLFYNLTVAANYENILSKSPSTDSITGQTSDSLVFAAKVNQGCISNFKYEWIIDGRNAGNASFVKLKPDSTMMGRVVLVHVRLTASTDTITLVSYDWFIKVEGNALRMLPREKAAGMELEVISGGKSFRRLFDYVGMISSDSKLNFEIYMCNGRKLISVQPEVIANKLRVSLKSIKLQGAYICTLKKNGTIIKREKLLFIQ